MAVHFPLRVLSVLCGSFFLSAVNSWLPRVLAVKIRDVKYNGIIFDRDGTLFDSLHVILRSFNYGIEPFTAKRPTDEEWFEAVWPRGSGGDGEVHPPRTHKSRL